MTSRRLPGISLAATLLALSASAWAQGNAQPPAINDGLNLRFANGIAAVVEDKPITVDDIRQRIAFHLPQLQKEARNEQEFNQRVEALQDEIIQELIDRQLMIKEFYKKKSDDDKEVKKIPTSYIDNRMAEQMIEEFGGDRSKFLAHLRAKGQTIREYRKEIEDDIVYRYMMGQQRKSQSIISPVKIEEYYNENKDKFYQDDSVHMRMIQLSRAPGEKDESLQARSEQLVAQLRKGDKFEDLARKYSQDTRRSRGGDWGWQKRADLKKEFSDHLFELKPGEHTEAILMPEGSFILFAEERKYAGNQSIDEVREQIERLLLQQMSRQNQERWLERLRRNGYVKHY